MSGIRFSPGVPLAQVATPSRMAQTVSRGRWLPALHLLAIEQAVLETICGRSPPLLVIEAPPRHGKSELISHYLPAWYLGTHPDRQVILTGYESSFARTWGRKARGLLEEWGEALFGVRVRGNLRAANDWGLEGFRGGMLTAGAGGPLTGRGAHLLIVDDPIKNSSDACSEVLRDRLWDWWESTASTRLEPGGCAIVIATRWHRDDLSGRILQLNDREPGLARRLHLPALAEADDVLGRAEGAPLWPERWPRDRLETMRRHKSLEWWNAMYQQNPGRGEYSLWPDNYFPEQLWCVDWPDRFEQSLVACDLATGLSAGDYAAAVFVGRRGEEFWADAVLERLPPELFLGRVLDLVEAHGAQGVLLELSLYDSLICRELDRQKEERGLHGLTTLTVRNSTRKEVRLCRLGSVLRHHRLHLRPSPGARLLLSQMQEFPQGRHDDGPDALEMGLRMTYPAEHLDAWMSETM